MATITVGAEPDAVSIETDRTAVLMIDMQRDFLEPGEPVIDKPGKGAFHATDLHAILQHRDVKQLVVTGVTTEVCVNTTVREANDRGYDCLVLEDCCGSYFPEFHAMGLKMIKAQGGIFGWVSSSESVIKALAAWRSTQ